MKLIIAIVNNDDAQFVNTGLTSNGFHVTKISSTGGFLMNGNSTFLLGVDESELDSALEVIKTHSKKRTQHVPTLAPGTTIYGTPDMKVSVGGATVFVLDIEKSLRF
ncbi:MAG: cyclic-di-AMP receptor [Clostridiales bacterium]|nr:cyclic-di-AMP receptor [Clostridiales bacterium]